MTQTLHAHRCAACAAKGEQVIWVHTEACKGVVVAHTCPKCGSSQKENWQQFLVEPGRLPQAKKQSGLQLETILGYVFLFTVTALLAYAGYLYYQNWRKGKAVAE